jgi:hypothetical protein
LCFENTKNVHPIKNKEKNKEKNNGCEPESYPLDLPVSENQAMALAGSAGEVLQGDGMGFYSSDAVVVINATSANQSGGVSHV